MARFECSCCRKVTTLSTVLTRYNPCPEVNNLIVQAEGTNLRGSITAWLTSCLFCLDSAALLMLNEQ